MYVHKLLLFLNLLHLEDLHRIVYKTIICLQYVKSILKNTILINFFKVISKVRSRFPKYSNNVKN